MKKNILTIIALLLILSVPVSAFEPVTADLTESFVLEKAEAAPVLDGVIADGEYSMITSYNPDNEDWFITDYGCVRQYACDGMPDYIIDVYGAWDADGAARSFFCIFSSIPLALFSRMCYTDAIHHIGRTNHGLPY